MIGLYSTWFIRIGSGPLWNYRISLEQERCQSSWWKNLLYINNYYGNDQLCMFQSWYLAGELIMKFKFTSKLQPSLTLSRHAALRLRPPSHLPAMEVKAAGLAFAFNHRGHQCCGTFLCYLYAKTGSNLHHLAKVR
jgi:hypothetical protein